MIIIIIFIIIILVIINNINIIIVIIIITLYKLATMSPFGGHRPHLVDNSDTLYLGNKQ